MVLENAIEVKNISKKFKVYYDKGTTLKEKVLFKKRRSFEERTVLNDISFSVKKGEAIGLVGHNGCGKSTTLKLLTKIMYPDSGSIDIKGRVSSLIELGAGFHPDMTGRENIYTNASIFGLTRKEIDRRVEDIIAFSELEEFIDNPVRTYSSGMYMRLAFSVAINVDAEVLLIDEILGVGDANFQIKCFNKLREIKAKGTTIVIVSHSLGQIEQICERSLWIHDGEIREEGEPRVVHMNYLDFMAQKRQEAAIAEVERQQEEIQQNAVSQEAEVVTEEVVVEVVQQEEDVSQEGQQEIIVQPVVTEQKRWGNGKAKITNVCMLNHEGRICNLFLTGEKIQIRIDYDLHEKVENAVFGIGIFRIDGLLCYGTNTRLDKLNRFDLNYSGTTFVTIDALNLITGNYLLDVAIESDEGIPVDYFREVYAFEMHSLIGDIGVARMNHSWNLSVEMK